MVAKIAENKKDNWDTIYICDLVLFSSKNRSNCFFTCKDIFVLSLKTSYLN